MSALNIAPTAPARASRVEILDVLVIGADIADMREGEGDDLAGIGRVGEDFLIAGERGVEAHFGDGAAGGAQASPLDHRAVGKDQQRGRHFARPGGGGAVMALSVAMALTCNRPVARKPAWRAAGNANP